MQFCLVTNSNKSLAAAINTKVITQQHTVLVINRLDATIMMPHYMTVNTETLDMVFLNQMLW